MKTKEVIGRLIEACIELDPLDRDTPEDSDAALSIMTSLWKDLRQEVDAAVATVETT